MGSMEKLLVQYLLLAWACLSPTLCFLPAQGSETVQGRAREAVSLGKNDPTKYKRRERTSTRRVKTESFHREGAEANRGHG